MKTPQKRIIDAGDARSLMSNPLLTEAFSAVEGYLDAQALACDADNKDKAQRIVISKQLLAGIKREITRYIEDGTVAEIQLQELERKKKLFDFRR